MKIYSLELLSNIRRYNPKAWAAIRELVGHGEIDDVDELADDQLLIKYVLNGDRRAIVDLNVGRVVDCA